jgi:hypothetical protein
MWWLLTVRLAGTTYLDAGTVVIQQAANVTATNLYLTGLAAVQGPGTLQISGTLTWNGSATVGGDPNSNMTLSILANATANLSGTPVLDHASFTNAGTVNLSGGSTLEVDNGAQITNNKNFFFTGSPTIEQTRGTVQSGITNTGLFQNNGTGTPVIGINYTSSGGRGQTKGNLKFTGAKVSLLDGTFDATGATIEVAGTFEEDGGSVLVGAGGTLTADSGFTQTGGDLSLSGTGVMNVTGAFQHSGGTTEIAGTSSLTTTTTLTVSGGTLTLQGGSLSATNGVQVQSGGTLTAYSGTITGAVSNYGILNLGDTTTAGTLSITGNYTQTGTLNAFLGGTSSGSYSRLNVSGQANLGGTLNVSFINGFMASPGNQFTILTYGSRSGTFATVNLPSLTTGHWNPLYDNPLNTYTLWVTL